MERPLRPSAGLVAGLGATVVALAFLGLAHIVQASVPFPPAGIAQRAVQAMPGSLAVGAIELLGHWALRLFVIGVGIATLALGAVLGRWVADRGPTAVWIASGLLGVLALAGFQAGPGVDFITYAVLCAIAALLWGIQVRGSLTRLRAPIPAPPEGARDDAPTPPVEADGGPGNTAESPGAVGEPAGAVAVGGSATPAGGRSPGRAARRRSSRRWSPGSPRPSGRRSRRSTASRRS
jgi:hypothetical protein